MVETTLNYALPRSERESAATQNYDKRDGRLIRAEVQSAMTYNYDTNVAPSPLGLYNNLRCERQQNFLHCMQIQPVRTTVHLKGDTLSSLPASCVRKPPH